GKVFGERGRELHDLAVDGVPELELGRVEALSTKLRHQLLGEFTFGRGEAQGLFDSTTISGVRHDRMSLMAQMGPYLMRPPRLERDAQQRVTRPRRVGRQLGDDAPA